MGARSCVAVVAIALLVAVAGWTAAQEPEVLATPVPQSPQPGRPLAGPPPYQPDQPIAPSPLYQPYQPGAVYDPIRAVEDAYRIAEESRQAAISRQLQLQQSLRPYGVWSPTPYRYALPYVYAYAPPRVARRVAREIDRWEAGGWEGHLRGLPVNQFSSEEGRGYFVKLTCTVNWTP